LDDAADDRAVLTQRHPHRDVNEWRLATIRLWEEGGEEEDDRDLGYDIMTKVSTTYVSVVDGERETITAGGSLAWRRGSERLNFRSGEWIRSMRVVFDEADYAAHRFVGGAVFTTSSGRAIRCGCVGDDVSEWEGGEADGVVPRYLMSGPTDSIYGCIGGVGFWLGKRVPEVLGENFTPADFTDLPRGVQRQIVALFSVDIFPECVLRAIASWAFPTPATIPDDDRIDDDDDDDDFTEDPFED